MIENWLIWIDSSAVYRGILMFFAGYPIAASILWITTTQFFRLRWENLPAITSHHQRPMVSVVMPSHNEERVIARSLRDVLQIQYPHFEVVVIDDGSTDDTLAKVLPMLADPRVRVIRKTLNEGKAMALNDALPCLRGEIIVCIDADASPAPDLLNWLVPHFTLARTGAVTGNPRVANVDSFLARLQLIEFTAIVSLLRRSQRIWGRIQTMSGVVCAVRKSALIDVGGFSPDMATEDIELTWKLQKRAWDVRYEPRAIVWMTVPHTYRTLIRQRLRWARGLAQVLHRHADVMLHWRHRRMWPVFIESVLSIAWASCMVMLVTLWCVSLTMGYVPASLLPLPNVWVMTLTTLCLAQLFWGIRVDARYDPDMHRYAAYAIYYPLIYWLLMALCTVVSLPHLFRAPRRRAVRWHTIRMRRESEA